MRPANSLRAEAAFRELLAGLGAELLEEWRGSRVRHHVRCPAAHDCYPYPMNAVRGTGICRTCARRDPVAAEGAFRARLTELGAELLEPKYLGSNRPHYVRCSAGHDTWPTPSRVAQGVGICRRCAGRERNRPRATAAEVQFRSTLADLGAVPLYDEWRGTRAGHHVQCPAGHDCWPHPGHVREGDGICRTCAGLNPAVAEAAFRSRLAELGARPLFEAWQGVHAPHRLRCSAGHDTYTRPRDVRDGRGVCRFCAGKAWDAFYVVTSLLTVKFGITSGDPSDRLGVHARQGFTNVVRIAPGLPGDVAPRAERAVMAALALAGERPVRGKEYFDISCLGLVVDVADSYTHPGAWS